MSRALAALLAAAVLPAGCTAQAPQSADFESGYLAPAAGKAPSFSVTYIQYAVEEQDLIERAWAKAEPPGDAAAALWTANGLRIGRADGQAATEVQAILDRATTVRAKKRDLVMPTGQPFEAAVGRAVAAMGLVYATKDATEYRDVASFQLMLKVMAVGVGEDARVSVSPFFYSGPETNATIMEGLEESFPFGGKTAILIGPVREPAASKLGSLFLRADGTKRSATLVVIEPRASR